MVPCSVYIYANDGRVTGVATLKKKVLDILRAFEY